MLILPFFLSITFFGGVVIVGTRAHKLNFFAGFLPSGVPGFIAPFLILIEVISYAMRVFSLAIRLFANILSGHILIKILVSVCWTLFYSLLAAKVFFGAILLGLIIAIMFLEIIVCILQAYVFVSLISMYLDEALKFNQH
jgi:ATP synthase subunit 6